MIKATVIRDSISLRKHRVTTIEATGHRFILSELNTHRVFSRNSASSRARPVKKVLAEVRDSPAIPVEFGSNQPGMQAGPPLDGVHLDAAIEEWKAACDAALYHAERLQEMGVHKQVANRILEPFMWHTVIITSTEWENFFAQRCHPDAQPEIRVLAEAIQQAYASSFPDLVRYDEWHLPYIQDDERESIDPLDLVKISAARCARVSYLTHDGQRDIDKDLKLYARLTEEADPPHWSPLEHVCTPARAANVGNLEGWHQLRHALDVNGSLTGARTSVVTTDNIAPVVAFGR